MNATAVVVDTHAIVWYLSEPERLSTRALQTLDDIVEAGGILYIASITVVELCYLVERRRLPESHLLGLDALLSGRDSALVLAPLDGGVARALRQIPRHVVPDMPDRIIAATGLHLGVPVVTRDAHLHAAPIVSIW